MSTPANVVPLENTSPNTRPEGGSTSGERVGADGDSRQAGLHGFVALTKEYYQRAVGDVLRPSISNFLRACNANSDVEAIVATPLLLGTIFFVVSFVVSTLVITLWEIAAISFWFVFLLISRGVPFVIKASVVTVVNIALAGFVTVAFITLNLVFQYVQEKARVAMAESGTGTPRATNEIDWRQVGSGIIAFANVWKQTFAMSTSIITELWKIGVQMALALSSSIDKTHSVVQERDSLSIVLRGSNAETRPQEPVQQTEEPTPSHITIKEGDTEQLELHNSTEGLRRRISQ